VTSSWSFIRQNVHIVKMGKFKQYAVTKDTIYVAQKLSSAALFSSFSSTTRGTELSPELQSFQA